MKTTPPKNPAESLPARRLPQAQPTGSCTREGANSPETDKLLEVLHTQNEVLRLELSQRTGQLRELAMDLTHAEQRERKRLAQLLHDDVQQLLVAVRMQANLATSGKNVEQVIPLILTLTDEAIECCRELVSGLRPSFAPDAELPETITWLANHMRRQHGLEVQLLIEKALQVPSQDLRTLLFEIARELLFNIVKHAQVNQALLQVGTDNDQVFLEVTDKGAGCDPSVLEGKTSENFGLPSISDRLSILGGSIRMWAGLKQGCRVRVQIPLTEVVCA